MIVGFYDTYENLKQIVEKYNILYCGIDRKTTRFGMLIDGNNESLSIIKELAHDIEYIDTNNVIHLQYIADNIEIFKQLTKLTINNINNTIYPVLRNIILNDKLKYFRIKYACKLSIDKLCDFAKVLNQNVTITDLHIYNFQGDDCYRITKRNAKYLIDATNRRQITSDTVLQLYTVGDPSRLISHKHLLLIISQKIIKSNIIFWYERNVNPPKEYIIV